MPRQSAGSEARADSNGPWGGIWRRGPMPYAVARWNSSRARRLTGAMAATGAAGSGRCRLAMRARRASRSWRSRSPARTASSWRAFRRYSWMLILAPWPRLFGSSWPGEAVDLVYTSPQGTPSAAWCWRMASSSGPSSRQYTLPPGSWHSSTWRTPNRSARAWPVSSAICAGPRRAAQVLVIVHEQCHLMLLSLRWAAWPPPRGIRRWWRAPCGQPARGSGPPRRWRRPAPRRWRSG